MDLTVLRSQLLVELGVSPDEAKEWQWQLFVEFFAGKEGINQQLDHHQPWLMAMNLGKLFHEPSLIIIFSWLLVGAM